MDERYFLKAMHTLLKKCDESVYVKDIMQVCIDEHEASGDDFFGDGYSLMRELKDFLEVSNEN